MESLKLVGFFCVDEHVCGFVLEKKIVRSEERKK